jgi:phosphotransferase system HPr-like phosphotransfer protein/mannitol/fructose-specific phosphotransferase system IIA component (Ntr-type)
LNPSEDRPFDYDVFLSYNAKDGTRVRRLAKQLRTAGVRVWLDKWVIKPGDDIYLAIERGLEASRALVLCLSPAALGSEWVTMERNTVLFRDPSNARRRFIPLLLADCTLPDTLRRYRYVDYRHESGAAFEELAKGLCDPKNWPLPTDESGSPTRILPPAEQGNSGQTPDSPNPRSPTPTIPAPQVVRMQCRLNCEESFSNILHLRPATFVVRLCQQFPHSQFRILRHSGVHETTQKAIDPKNIMELASAGLVHGEEITLEVTGKCRVMAAEFLKTTIENLEKYSDDIRAAKNRLARLIDEAFAHTQDPDTLEFGSEPAMPPPEQPEVTEGEYRAVARINDRLHNLSLPIIPLIAKRFACRTTIAFEDAANGIYWFTMGSERGFELDDGIMDLPIEVGTRITILTSGPNRFRTSEAIKNVLESLWECDEWLRRNTADLNDAATIEQFLVFAAGIKRSRGSEFAYVHNPFLSNLLTPKQVFVNSLESDFSKDDLLRQLAAPLVNMHGLDMAMLLSAVKDVVLREGFALVHAALDRGPRIAMTLGVYPKGVIWGEDGKKINLVCMFIFAKDTYKTWLDYMRKMSIVFRENPRLKEQLTCAENNEELLRKLRQAETGTIRQKV